MLFPHEGRRLTTPKVGSILQSHMARDDETPTRQKVAELIDKGFSVLEIAHHLRISPQAVYKHINRYGLAKPSERKERTT